MPKIAIKSVLARQILDSRGLPTLEVHVEFSKGVGVFGVPSGTSTGKAEALELRDGGKEFLGQGVSRAVEHVNNLLAKRVKGMDVMNQQKLDEVLLDLDGTPNKSRLGANALLGVSAAACKAAAIASKLPLYKYVAKLHGQQRVFLPQPMFNVINGGKHGDSNLDIQEIMLVPKAPSFAKQLELAVEVFHHLKKVLKLHRLDSDLGNEGGYSPNWESNQQALNLIMVAVKQAGLEREMQLALDAAASEFYSPDERQYILSADHTSLNSERLVSLYNQWVEQYPLVSIEDGLAEEDWSGWQAMQKRLGEKLLLVGDDLFVTQKPRLQKGIEAHVGNAIIIKPNQVGTITETLETVKLAQAQGYKTIASHRSGETNDDFIADFAVGISADYLKAGSVARGERVAKWNRLLAIEEELK